MDELGLENPKASPAETLRAYRFFSEEAMMVHYTVYFAVLELFCVLIFWFVGQLKSDIQEVASALSSIRTVPAWIGVNLAWGALWWLSIRHRRLLRLRLSIWERELKLYCASRRTIVGAAIAVSVALAAWIVVIVIGLP
jgi:hypothetical protein